MRGRCGPRGGSRSATSRVLQDGHVWDWVMVVCRRLRGRGRGLRELRIGSWELGVRAVGSGGQLLPVAWLDVERTDAEATTMTHEEALPPFEGFRRMWR